MDRDVSPALPWGKCGCSHPLTLGTWVLPLLDRASECPSSSRPCPQCLEQNPVSLACVAWLLPLST